MNYLFVTTLNQYDSKVYGKADLKMCNSDGEKFARMVPESWMLVRLTDRDCLRSEVLSQLQWIAEQMKEGDTCYWYHSGHGTYADRGRSRATARCMWDGPLWDTDVAKALAKFPAGSFVMAISDTCFSESNSRHIFSPPEHLTGIHKKSLGKSLVTPPPSASKQTFAAAVITISACTVAQVSWETAQTGGVFTHCLARIYSNYPAATIGKLIGLLKAFLMDYPEFEQTPVMWTNTKGKSKKPLVFLPK